MSKFLSRRFDDLTPYVPGEQPQGVEFVKLNTNECPFAPSPKVAEAIANFDGDKLRLYPNPESTALVDALSKMYGVATDNIFVGNGSDEVLAFIFMAFFDSKNKVCFPDISYGFYPVYCDLFGLQKNEIVLHDDFTVDTSAYISAKENIILANPNAPTGIALSILEIEKIVASNPNRLVVIDEAYVDFGASSAVTLTKQFKNLIVVQTLSKSRALAGARLGVAIADKELIEDIKAMKYSFNSYNVNRLTESVAVAAVEDVPYFEKCVAEIKKNREWTVKNLCELGFEVLPSSANFVFARHKNIEGETLYEKLKQNGVLVRHFNKERIKDFVRITIGDGKQMQRFVAEVKNILRLQ